MDKIIKIDDVEGKVYELDDWKPVQGNQVKKYFSNKFVELKKEYDLLVSDFNWNKVIFESEMLFIPVMGKTYYLYKKKNGKNFMSLINPADWNVGDKFEFVGAFVQDSRQKWNKIDKF
tara:strand:- start:523 stop:876 length:354 start_codon:yes stop_codon:yes gene_type:complete